MATWSRYARNCASHGRKISEKLQPEVVSAASVVNVVNVVNVAVYVSRKSFVETKDESFRVTIKTSSFPLRPVPLSFELRPLLVAGYLLLMMLRRLLNSYYTCSDYSHWVLVLEGVGVGCSMNADHDLV